MSDLGHSCIRCTWPFLSTEGKYLLPFGPHLKFPTKITVYYSCYSLVQQLRTWWKMPKISVLTPAGNRANNRHHNIIIILHYNITYNKSSSSSLRITSVLDLFFQLFHRICSKDKGHRMWGKTWNIYCLTL